MTGRQTLKESDPGTVSTLWKLRVDKIEYFGNEVIALSEQESLW